MQVEDIIRRVRTEIGDPEETFRASFPGDGTTTWFNLPKQNLDSSNFVVTVIDGASMTDLDPATQYSIDFQPGTLMLNTAPPVGSTVVFAGKAWGMFTDDEIVEYIRDAVNWHVYTRKIEERYRDIHGFMTYRETPINLVNLPEVEEPLLIWLTTINIFWTLADDAAKLAGVHTAEGTMIDNTARYTQLMTQIGALTDRYETWCRQLNVGPFAFETLELRRVSRRTGRLVPLMKPREFDDHRYPVRKLPPRTDRYEDNSGVPSQLWYGGSGNG